MNKKKDTRAEINETEKRKELNTTGRHKNFNGQKAEQTLQKEDIAQ